MGKQIPTQLRRYMECRYLRHASSKMNTSKLDKGVELKFSGIVENFVNKVVRAIIQRFFFVEGKELSEFSYVGTSHDIISVNLSSSRMLQDL